MVHVCLKSKRIGGGEQDLIWEECKKEVEKADINSRRREELERSCRKNDTIRDVVPDLSREQQKEGLCLHTLLP